MSEKNNRMKIIAAGKSDVGRIRKNNEDAFLVDDRLGLYAVADGIGGHEGGEVASRLAIEGLARGVEGFFPGACVTQTESGTAGEDAIKSALDQAFAQSNRSIRSAAAGSPALDGMGTTMTALLLHGNTVHLAHIGDSRAYRYRGGVLMQMTDDHSVIAEQMRAGLLTSEQARRSPYRHVITRALGIDSEITVDHRSIEAEPGDTFLLCTDGLTEMVADTDIRRILSGTPPREAPEMLIRTANDQGGVDNITVVVVHFGDEPGVDPGRA